MYSESNVEQFIVFRIANYFFALSIRDILQVVNYPLQTSNEISQLGLVQLGHHIIKVVDLHQQCNSVDFPHSSNSQPFLMIARDPQGGFCGIPVYEPPELVELPLERLRSLPQSEAPFGVLKIASHAAVLSLGGNTTTVFLLDMQQALTVNSTSAHLLPSQVSI